MAAAIINAARREGEELLKSGRTVGRNASARVGFMPLALEHVVLEGLREIPVFLRTLMRGLNDTEYQFTMYSSHAARFTESHRRRLMDAGVKFIYIQLQHQMQFRQQLENFLHAFITDDSATITAKSELVYETSVELVDELLVEQDLGKRLPRLETIAKAVTTLAISDQSAFSHLFAASQHDFYTATHMVNVGTWMVSLAYSCGIRDMGQLNLMCVAGMVHDIGKIFVSEKILNKRGALTEAEWQELRSHPMLGVKHLSGFSGVPPLVMQVTGQHHERMDGSGYPHRISGEAISLASRICAVVDSFDAMTAYRPYKDHTRSFSEALKSLEDGAGVHYDKEVVAAWKELMKQASDEGVVPGLRLEDRPMLGRRGSERFSIDCPGRVQVVRLEGGKQMAEASVKVRAHNLSQSGVGLMSEQAIAVSQYVRVELQGTGTLENRVIEGVVVRSRAFSDGWHEVGIQMAPLKGEEEAARRAGDAAGA